MEMASADIQNESIEEAMMILSMIYQIRNCNRIKTTDWKTQLIIYVMNTNYDYGRFNAFALIGKEKALNYRQHIDYVSIGVCVTLRF